MVPIFQYLFFFYLFIRKFFSWSPSKLRKAAGAHKHCRQHRAGRTHTSTIVRVGGRDRKPRKAGTTDMKTAHWGEIPGKEIDRQSVPAYRCPRKIPDPSPCSVQGEDAIRIELLGHKKTQSLDLTKRWRCRGSVKSCAVTCSTNSAFFLEESHTDARSYDTGKTSRLPATTISCHRST